MVITNSSRMKNALALVFAAMMLWWLADSGSSVYAGGKKQKGGSPMASPDNLAAAGTAAGYISLNGVKLVVRYAYALAQPNAFDEKKLDIAVLLTKQPLPDDEFKDAEGLEYVAHKKHNYALFKINDQGKPIYEVIEHPVLENTRLVMSGFTSAEFVPEVFSKDRIQGSFKTRAETDFSGYKYEINVKFSAQVGQAKLPDPLPDDETGRALPPDGGGPAKAYRAYCTAIKNKDVAAFRKLSQPPPGVKMSDDEMKENLDFMASVVPKNLKVLKGYVNAAGERAVVYVTGTEEGEKRYGTIEMIRKNEAWMVKKESWSDTPLEK